MTLSTLTAWAQAHPWLAMAYAGTATSAAVLTVWGALLACRGIGRAAGALRTALQDVPVAVRVAAVAAAACTAYSADTSWRFAEHHLDMHSTTERACMFAAAEGALVACGLLARQNLRTEGRPGLPGTLVWAITGVQIIPAYAESGVVGGTVRAFVGPVLAALLWHQAMGIELRTTMPGTLSEGLVSVVGREVRERTLSRLGLSRRGRDAAQITRDRWTVRAVDLAARLSMLPRNSWRARRVEQRLSRAVGRSEVGVLPEQRQRLLDLLAARRHAPALARMDLPVPWQTQAAALAPRTPQTVAAGALAGMEEIEAVRAVARAHPGATHEDVARLCAAHGLPVTSGSVAVALHGQQRRTGVPVSPLPPKPRPDAPSPRRNRRRLTVVKPELRPASRPRLGGRRATAEEQVRQIVALMRQGGGTDAVTWTQVKEQFGLSKPAASRRLNAARACYAAETGTDTPTGTGRGKAG